MVRVDFDSNSEDSFVQPEKKSNFKIFLIIAILIIVLLISVIVFLSLDDNNTSENLEFKECKIYDEQNDNWNLGLGIICNDASDCTEEKNSFLKGVKTDCLESKYVSPPEELNITCARAQGFQSYFQMPSEAVKCNGDKALIIEGAYNFIVYNSQK